MRTIFPKHPDTQLLVAQGIVKVHRFESTLAKVLFGFVTFGFGEAFNPFNGVLYTIERVLDDREIRHEFGIHRAQVRDYVDEYGWPHWRAAAWFVLRHVLWASVVNLGWANTPAEKEAGHRDEDPEYLKSRKPFAWREYT